MSDQSTASPVSHASVDFPLQGSLLARKIARHLASTPASARVELNRADYETQLPCSSPEGGERLSVTEQLTKFARLLSAKEVAAILKVHPETVYTLVRDEALPSIRVGRSRRFDSVLLAKWLAERSS